MANFIHFSVMGLYAGSVNSSSGIFAGENLQYGWRSTAKTNLATGKICGDYSVVLGGRQDVIDPDYVDTYIQQDHPFTSQTPPSPVLMGLMAKRKRDKRSPDESWDW